MVLITTSTKVTLDQEAARKLCKQQQPATALHTRREGHGSNAMSFAPLALSEEAGAQLLRPGDNGLLTAVKTAYNNHIALRLRPDDIWLAIAQGVATHINAPGNSEALRSKFVAHEGKKELVAVQDGPPNWPLFVDQLVSLAEANMVDKMLPAALQCDFSTTCHTSLTASRMVVLKAMESYFSYKCMTCCGIPQVILDGTLADWQSLLTKVDKVDELDLGLSWWFNNLKPVLQQLVNTYQGCADEEFWSTIIKHKSYGSGPGSYTGWICTLFPYDAEGKTQRKHNSMADDDVPCGLQSVAFKHDVFGTVYDRVFKTGYVGCHVDVEEGSVSPVIGWLVAEDRSKQEQA